MGMLDQFKMASEMMKGMSPDQIKEMMQQAQESKKMIEDIVRKIVAEEVEKRGLVSRSEVEKMTNK